MWTHYFYFYYYYYFYHLLLLLLFLLLLFLLSLCYQFCCHSSYIYHDAYLHCIIGDNHPNIMGQIECCSCNLNIYSIMRYLPSTADYTIMFLYRSLYIAILCYAILYYDLWWAIKHYNRWWSINVIVSFIFHHWYHDLWFDIDDQVMYDNLYIHIYLFNVIHTPIRS